METFRTKRKWATVNRDNQEEHPRNGMSGDTNTSGINEEYVIQVSEEIEGRVIKTSPKKSKN